MNKKEKSQKEKSLPKTESSHSRYIGIREGLPGLTWRSLLALIYIAVCFQPGFAYLQLITLSPIGMSVVQWATILLFLELSRLTGKPLTKQEIIVIFLGTVGASRFLWFLQPSLSESNKPGWLYQIYFAHSPAVQMFGLSDKIPWFYSPVSEDPWIFRTFFHPSWIPILLNTIAFGVAAYISDVCLGLVMYRLYVVEEKLPFPRVRPVVAACDALIEREWTRMGVLSIVSILSALYGFAAYVFPLLTKTFMGRAYTLIPIPWYDFTPTLQLFVPGISFGIATSLSTLGYGFIIPFKAALGTLIASIAIYIIGNPFIIQNKISDFYKDYSVGMNLQNVWQRSFLHMWAMPLIGFGLAIGVTPLLLNIKVIRRIFSGLGGKGAARELYWVLLAYLAVTIGLSLWDYYLAPDTPIIIFIFLNTIWLFISALIRVRGMGYGLEFGIPYMRELTMKISGYTGINGWFVPTLYGGVGWAQNFKICDMTQTRKIDYIIGVYIALPIGLLVAFYYMQSFWTLAPIPSNVYPGVLYSWPILSTFQSLFITPEGSKFFVVDRIIYSFIIGVVLYVIGSKLGFPELVVGMAAGIASPIPTAITTFIGAALGLVLGKYIRFWRKNVGLIVAGIVLGEGLITSIGASIIIIAKSVFALPY